MDGLHEHTHTRFSSIPTMRMSNEGAASRLWDGSHLLAVSVIPSRQGSHMPTSHLHFGAGPLSYLDASFSQSCTLRYGSIWLLRPRAASKWMSMTNNPAPSTATLASM